MRDLSVDEIDEALSFVSPDVARADWVQIGMALKAELADGGFDLFDRWSQGSDKYKAADCKSTWRSIKASGGVGLGTLIRAAQDAGWKLKPDERDEADRQRYAAEMAERRRLAAEKNAAEEAWRGRMAGAVAEGCQRLCQWLAENQNPEQVSPYLVRKQVGNHGGFVVASPVLLVVDEADESCWIVTGEHITSFFSEFNRMPADRKDQRSVRKLSAGDLVLPLMGVDGYTRSVQIIYQSGRKSFPRHGDKSGCLIAMYGDDDSVWCFAEGYATAASIHEATGRTVFACLDAGNLVTVVNAVAVSNPGKPLLICADDDAQIGANRIENPGLEFAMRAAAGKPALVVSPDWSVIEQQEAA